MSSLLASAILNAVWQIPILTAAGWVTTRILRRVGPAAEHRVWVGVLVLSLVLPLLPARHLGSQKRTENVSAVHDRNASQPMSVQYPSHQVGLIRLPSLVVNTLCGLWALTVLCGTLRLSVGLLRTKRLLATATPYKTDDDLQKLWQECCELMHIGFAALFVSKDVRGPVTLVIDTDAVILPLGFSKKVEREDLRAALLHECAHVKRKDFRNNLLYQLLALPVQFHPAVWFVKQQLASSREMACDNAVVRATREDFAYGDKLLRLATWIGSPLQVSSTHAVGMFDANILEERIMRIRSGQPLVARTTHFALMGLSACVLMIGAASAMAASIEVASPAHGRASGAQPTYTVGKDVTAPQLVFQVEPEYTPAARAAKVSGECVVAVVVNAQGVPQDAHVTKSLRTDLDANAIATVKQYRFRPGLHDGKPVQVQVIVSVNYQIF